MNEHGNLLFECLPCREPAGATTAFALRLAVVEYERGARAADIFCRAADSREWIYRFIETSCCPHLPVAGFALAWRARLRQGSTPARAARNQESCIPVEAARPQLRILNRPCYRCSAAPDYAPRLVP